MRGWNALWSVAAASSFERSPRTRVEHRRLRMRVHRLRSIPARAGGTASARTGGRRSPIEPRERGWNSLQPVVDSFSGPIDPRVHGWNLTGSLVARAYTGRSPRAREERGSSLRVGPMHRSIPACAGETWMAIPTWWCFSIDPRVRGWPTNSPLAHWISCRFSDFASWGFDVIWINDQNGKGSDVMVGSSAGPQCCRRGLRPNLPR